MRIKKLKIYHILVLFLFVLVIQGCENKIKQVASLEELPNIYPDYQYVTIPSNIAPLNFKIKGSSNKILVEFKYKAGKTTVTGKGKIDIPIKKWRKVLNESKGDSIIVTVYEKYSNSWKQYKSFSIYVSSYEIDSHLVYRLIAPGYENWSKMGIYQRDLTVFKQKAIIENTLIPGSCVNCHSYKMNDPGKMMFHLRAPNGSTFIIDQDKIKSLDTRSGKLIANCVYPYWHPSGNYIAFSVNKVSQAFHSAKEKRIEVIDSKSDIVVIDIINDKIITSDLITTDTEFETFPCFSPDGKYLYFTSAVKKEIPAEYNQIRYNLKRISFNPEIQKFGNRTEMIINADSMGKSISFPRVSPDGKYLMFTMADYGNFTIWHKEADLYVLDLQEKKYFPLKDANSNDAESYHSWSSDSRWFAFGSRRDDGLYTRPYLCFFDEKGKPGKPFLIPQKDPDYYTSLLFSFNIPELVKGETKIDHLEIESKTLKGKPDKVH